MGFGLLLLLLGFLLLLLLVFYVGGGEVEIERLGEREEEARVWVGGCRGACVRVCGCRGGAGTE